MGKKLFIAGTLTLLAFGTLSFRAARSGVAAAATLPAVSNDCDRDCLNGFVDKYLAAVVAHDPSKLPHTADAKYSENNVALQLGDGLWATADGIGSYKIYIDDPQAGEVGYYGVISEDGHPSIFGVRLKVVHQQVSEIEVVVARRDQPNSAFGNPDALKDKPVFSEDIPADKQLSRDKLASIANSYFSTIQQNTGKIYAPFASDCQRIENGAITANNPDGNGVSKQGCEEQLNKGLLVFVTRCRDRRFVVVDQQKGLVLVNTFFDHAGVITQYKLTDGTPHTVGPPFDRPYSFNMFELFKVNEEGKIRQIEAVIITVPYHMPTPWPTAPTK
jgi:hypothetical protein